MNPFDKRDRDLDDEIQAHLNMAKQDRIARGESPQEADAAVQREFGNIATVKEVTREMWRWASLERVFNDTKYAARMLRRNPGFALTACLCLALGIAATTATFSLADALLLRPLPVHDPSKLLVVTTATNENTSEGLSYRDLVHLQQSARSFQSVTAFQLAAHTIGNSPDATPRRRMGMYVAGDFFGTLGVHPRIGRPFQADERDLVIILSHSYWQSDFGGQPDIAGRTIRVNGQPFTIIGVAPEGFTVHNNLNPAYYIPFTVVNRVAFGKDSDPLEDRSVRGLATRGRLAPNATKAEAEQEIASIGRSLAAEFPDTHERHRFVVRTELEERIQQSPPMAAVSALLIVLAVAVLIISCANVTSLLLARSRARSREISIRLSVGAGRGRLLQQLLTESLVLSLVAACAGTLLALAAIRYLASIQIPTDTPLVIAARLDVRVLLAALVAAIMASLVAGVAPAWRTVSRTVKPATHSRGRNSLVICQVALSVVLLVVSGALIDAFRRILIQDPGIRTDRIMMVELDPSLVRYTPQQTRQFFRTLTERASALPGARSVALSRAIPFRPNFTEEQVVPEGYLFPEGQKWITVSSNVVDDNYFATMQVDIVKGHGFTRADTRPVAVINEEFARRFWPGEDPLHKRFRLGAEGPWLEVIGVTRTGKYLSVAETPQPYFYLPFEQHLRTRMTLLVETEGDAAAMASPLLELIRSVDPNQPVYNVRDMRTYFHHGVVGLALTAMQVVWAMAGAGLLLACIGLYGLISFSVARRTREIGVRIAIGADRSRVLRLFLRQGLRISAAGILVGLALSIPAFRGLSAGLAGLGDLSPLTLLIAPVCLLLVAMAASWLPARNASRIDPSVALRLD